MSSNRAARELNIQAVGDVASLQPKYRSKIEKQFAEEVGLRYRTAQAMRGRNSIAPRYFDAVVHAAQERGFNEINQELLTKLAAQKYSDADG